MYNIQNNQSNQLILEDKNQHLFNNNQPKLIEDDTDFIIPLDDVHRNNENTAQTGRLSLGQRTDPFNTKTKYG